MPEPGDVVWIKFPGVVATKQRPAIIVSSKLYHSVRPDVIVGLVTSQILKATAPTDYLLVDWAAAGLHVPSAFRAFFNTLPARDIISTMGRLSVADLSAVRQRIGLAIPT